MANTDGQLPPTLLCHLAEVAQAEGFTSYTVEYEADAKAGDGFIGTMLSVVLVGERGPDDKAARLPLICKQLPTSEERNEQFASRMLFDREIALYTRILPALGEFQRSKGIAPEDGLRAYPKCYSAKTDPQTKEAILILEDLRQSGHTMWGKTLPLRYDNAKLVMEQFGLLHGVSVALRDQKPELFAEYERLPNIFAKMSESSLVQALFATGFDGALQVLEKPEHIEVVRRLKRDWREINVRCMDREELGAFAVLNHGDAWNNNFMYTAAEDGTAKSVCMLDWQMTRITTPAVDISYFLFSSTDRALRDQHLAQLLNTYYAKFAGIIRQCGSDPDRLYTFADLQQQLRKFAIYGVLVSPVLISIMVTAPENIVNLDELAKNTNDSESSATLATITADSARLYKQRVTDVLDESEQLGWLADYLSSSAPA